MINYLPFNKTFSKCKYHSNPMWGTLKNWKILLSLFTTLLIGWNVLTQKETTFQNRIWIHFVSLTCFLWVAKFSVWLKAQPFQRDESVLPQNSRKYNSFCLDHYLINVENLKPSSDVYLNPSSSQIGSEIVWCRPGQGFKKHAAADFRFVDGRCHFW